MPDAKCHVAGQETSQKQDANFVSAQKLLNIEMTKQNLPCFKLNTSASSKYVENMKKYDREYAKLDECDFFERMKSSIKSKTENTPNLNHGYQYLTVVNLITSSNSKNEKLVECISVSTLFNSKQQEDDAISNHIASLTKMFGVDELKKQELSLSYSIWDNASSVYLVTSKFKGVDNLALRNHVQLSGRQVWLDNRNFLAFEHSNQVRERCGEMFLNLF